MLFRRLCLSKEENLMTSQLPYKNIPLSRKTIAENVPRRGGTIVPILATGFLKLSGWKTVGEIANVPQAVCLAVPHTSNVDGVYAIPAVLSLDFGISLMGKKSLFKNPIMGAFMRWAGVIPINRKAKGSVLQATIDKFKEGKPLFIGLAPEGTRGYTKEIRFMNPVYPTGDYEADLTKILEMYRGVEPKDPSGLSQPLQDLKKQG